jgi:hypothetical protein
MATEISKGRRITGWILNGLVSTLLTLSGIAKLVEAEAVVETLGGSGFGDYIPLLGAIEVLSVILFLIPATRAYGRLAIIAYLGGVIAVECYTGELPAPGIALSVIFWVGLYLRKPHFFKV